MPPVSSRRPDVEAASGEAGGEPSSWSRSLSEARATPFLLRWLVAVFLCCLLDEILIAFGALYLREHLGAGPLARVAVLSAFSAGTILGLVTTERLLARVQPRRLLAGAACGCTVAYLGWLAAPSLAVGAVFLGLVGVFAAPLYPIAKAQAYAVLPGRATTVNALAQLLAPAEIAAPYLLAAVAGRWGLPAALLLLLLQPLGILAVVLSMRCGEDGGSDRLARPPRRGSRDTPRRPNGTPAGTGQLRREERAGDRPGKSPCSPLRTVDSLPLDTARPDMPRPCRPDHPTTRRASMDKQTLIDALNDDLAAELQAMIQYITYAAKATGPYRPQLSEFFLAEVADEQGHAQYLANKIVALGGEPTTTPKPVPAAGSNKEMLEAVLAAERDAIRGYTERARQAEEYGDKGLAVQLEDMVRDEQGHSEETERILRDWPL